MRVKSLTQHTTSYYKESRKKNFDECMRNEPSIARSTNNSKKQRREEKTLVREVQLSLKLLKFFLQTFSSQVREAKPLRESNSRK